MRHYDLRPNGDVQDVRLRDEHMNHVHRERRRRRPHSRDLLVKHHVAKPRQADVRVRRRIHSDWYSSHHEVDEGRALRARVEAAVIMRGRTDGLDLICGDNSAELGNQQTGVVDVCRGHGLQSAVNQHGAVGCRVNDAGGKQRRGICAQDCVLIMHRWLDDPACSQ